jgi:hypothetical protein
LAKVPQAVSDSNPGLLSLKPLLILLQHRTLCRVRVCNGELQKEVVFAMAEHTVPLGRYIWESRGGILSV